MTNPAKRILLMDDSPLFLDVARQALTAAGYSVRVAQNLAELEESETEAEFDLVLMDVQMPEAFGDDVAMILRAVRGIDIPIYLLSSLDGSVLRERAEEAGIDGFITKHDGVENLVARVDDILGGTDAR